MSRIGAAVVGTGFIGAVHVEALRRLGVNVTGVIGSSPGRARQKAGLPEPYESFEAMLDDDRVRVVHLTTPNHLHYPQVKAVLAAGRKNRLVFELDGAEGSLAWSSERPEELWLGHRDRPNERFLRDPGQLDASAAAFTDYPGGHAEGFPDTFKQLYRAVYAAVEEGRMPAEPDFPTFADGHEETLLGEAIARSAAEERWVEVAR